MGFSAKGYDINVPSMGNYSSNNVDYVYVDNPIENVEVSNCDNGVEVLSFTNSNAIDMNLDYQQALANFNEAQEVGERIGATVTVFAISLVEGLGQFGETLVDTAATLVTALKTPSAWLTDRVAGLFGYETHFVDKLWDNTKSFVAKEHVKGWTDNFYQNTSVGKSLAENAYAFDTVRGVGNGVGYVTGVVALTAVTFGTGTAAMGAAEATTIGMSEGMGIIGATAGFGKGAQKAWSEGASTGKGLLYAAGTGAWEGVQFYLGGKIGEFGGLGDKLATKVFGKTVSKLGRSSSRILLDAADSGLEGFVQPGLDSIYKDGTYKELFEQSGGWKSVGIQAAIGAGMSGIGETGNLRKHFFDKDTNLLIDDLIKNNYSRESLDNVSNKVLNGKISLEKLKSMCDDNTFKIIDMDVFDKKINIIFKEGKEAAKGKYVGFFKNFREHAGLHTKEVRDYAVTLAEGFGISEKYLDLVDFGSWTHDLGMKGGWFIPNKHVLSDIDGITDDQIKRVLDYSNGKYIEIDSLDKIFRDEFKWSDDKISFEIANIVRANHPLNSAVEILSGDVCPYGVDKQVAALLAMTHSKSTSGIKSFSDKSMWLDCVDKLETTMIDAGKGDLINASYLKKLINNDTEFLNLQDAALCIRDGDAMSVVPLVDGRTIMQTEESVLTDISGTKYSYDESPVSRYGDLTNKELAKKESAEIRDYVYNSDGTPKIVDGKQVEIEIPISKRLHAGELNVQFESKYAKMDGNRNYSATVMVKDPTVAPISTLGAIEERAGEVVTYTNCTDRSLTIKLPKEMEKTELGNWYESHLQSIKDKQIDKLVKGMKDRLTQGKCTASEFEAYKENITNFYNNQFNIDWV